jgi:hypothetical protein
MKINDRVGHLKLGYGIVVDIPSSDMVTIKWDNTPDFWYNCGVNPCTISKNELTVFSNSNCDDFLAFGALLSHAALEKINDDIYFLKKNDGKTSSELELGLEKHLDYIKQKICKVFMIPKDLLYSDMEKK